MLYGQTGADTFVFATHGAGEYDVIADFEANGIDLIQIAGVAGGSNAARFEALNATQQGDDVVFTHGSHTIVLEDVWLGDLSAADFIFV